MPGKLTCLTPTFGSALGQGGSKSTHFRVNLADDPFITSKGVWLEPDGHYFVPDVALRK